VTRGAAVLVDSVVAQIEELLAGGVAAGVNPRFFGGTSLAACCQAWVMNKGPSPAPCS
jgi:hypothetical protein